MNNTSYFTNFTSLYSLSKTLRFELKPHELTSGLDEVVLTDTRIKQQYQTEMKPLFDALHFRFISASLAQVTLPVELLEKLFKRYKELKSAKSKHIESELAEDLAELRSVITDSFTRTGNEWKTEWMSKGLKVKSTGYKVLTDEGILEVLTAENPEKADVIGAFRGFFTYFSGFNTNRENYYSEEEEQTAVAHRVVNENLLRFMDNLLIMDSVSAKVPDLTKRNKIRSITDYSRFLNQEGIETYNAKIVGDTNAVLNQYSQQHPGTFSRLPKLKLLYKQIGSPKRGLQIFTISKGEEWQRLGELIEKQNAKIIVGGSSIRPLDHLHKAYKTFFESTSSGDYEQIYVNQRALNTLSSYWFTGGWQSILLKLKEFKLANKNKEGEVIIPKVLSLSELKRVFDALDEQDPHQNNLFRDRYAHLFRKTVWETFLAIWEHEVQTKFDILGKAIGVFESTKKEPFDKHKHKNIVKDVCDAYLEIEQMTKYFVVPESLPKYDALYEGVSTYLEETSLKDYYNAFRNLISKRPVNEEKVKLNFHNSTLLDGWDMNKEKDNLCVLLKNTHGDYYLAVMHKNSNIVFDKKRNPALYNVRGGKSMQKLEYKLLPGPNKMLPKVIFAKSNEHLFDIPSEIRRIREDESFKKGKTFNEKDLRTWIAFMQDSIQKYPGWQTFGFTFRRPEEYEDVSKFYNEVSEQGYKINWTDISEDVLLDLVRNKKVYLFKIHSKDIGTTSNGGAKNLHTILFHELLKPVNTSRLKLLGGGELFYRAPSTEKVMKTVRGKAVLDAKRFYEPKYFLHFPVEIRGTGSGYKNEMNSRILKSISTTRDVNIIGIDRGEKHLLYYSVIKPDGTQIAHGSLNRIPTPDGKLVDERSFTVLERDMQGKPAKLSELEPTGRQVDYVDYHTILSYYELKRNIARRSWDTIGAIKNFKEGYLSQVVHELYQLMLTHNAIIVLEDLNSEFKAKRTAKVEKSVYDKFEIALAKKLNHLVVKSRTGVEAGSILNPYQLTPAINAKSLSDFKSSKQWGPLFYVRANYTSTTDPVTGWRKHIYIPSGASVVEIQSIFKGSKSEHSGIQIRYDSSRNAFAFTYIFDEREWTLHATPITQRMRFDAKKRTNVAIPVFEELKSLFTGFDLERSLSDQIWDAVGFDWKRLAFLWNMLNQIRNTDRNAEGNESDYIQSPVAPFFDSRNPENEQKGHPVNGDANGAYHIAKKGALLIDRIRSYARKDPEFLQYKETNGLNLYVSDTDWGKGV